MRKSPKLGTTLAAIAFSCLIAGASINYRTQIQNFTEKGRKISVTEITPDILRVENIPAQQNEVKKPEGFESTLSPFITDTANTVIVNGTTLTTSAGITATIDPKTGMVNISAPNMSITDSGIRTNHDGENEIKLYTGSEGSFYGTGERGHAFDLRGDTLIMYNRQNYGYTKGDQRISQMNITMPLFLSSDGYAIVFDDYAPAKLILGEPVTYVTENKTPLTYYVVYGDGSLPETSRRLSEVIGRQDLAPLWSLGYITSKYGYHNQNETLGAVDTLRRNGYPVDGIVLDLYWYGKEEDMGRLEWDGEKWPDVKGMLDSLKKNGVNLVAISQPYVLTNGKAKDNFDYFSENRMLVLDSAGNTHPVTIWVGEGGMFDVSNPQTVKALRDIYKKHTDLGVTGWWGDLGEPEVHPETGMHHNGLNAREYHNRYGNDWSQIIYDLFKEEYPDTRLMTLMRGGTTGLQRYSVFPWSTDVSRSWGGLQPQITIMLNSGLSGLGYMSHDVGGFAIDPQNPIDPELYVRWLQLGLFSPVLRTHAQAFAEPYHYPELQDIILPIIRERYRWLPYNYTLAYENARYGLPLVRPLEYYSSSTLSDGIDDEYLWGRDILVAPVLTQGTTARDIKFPEGTDRWIDISDESKIFNGGTTVHDYPAPLNVLPLFVREGAFIPSAPYPMENTSDYSTSTYRVDYYPLEGTESEYELFEDDLHSTGTIDKNEFLLIKFNGKEENGTIDVKISSEGSYPSMAKEKSIEFVVHGLRSQPREAIVNGEHINVGEYFNATSHNLAIPLTYNVGSTCFITIE